MNSKDNRLIFEAYFNKKKLINEAPPIDMSGDIYSEPAVGGTLPGKGKGYGQGAIEGYAAKAKISLEDAVKNMARFISSKMPEKKEVSGKTVLHYPGDPKTFEREITPEFSQTFGVSKTNAGFTIRIVLDYVLKATKTSGGLKKTGVQRKAERISAVKAKKVAPVSVYEVDKSKPVADPVLKIVKNGLPEEDVPAREILSLINQIINDYNDTPGLDPAKKIKKIKNTQIVDALIKVGVLAEKEVTPQAEPEAGVGTGEAPTQEEREALEDAADDQEFINTYAGFGEAPGGGYDIDFDKMD